MTVSHGLVDRVWERLPGVTHLVFQAISGTKSQTQWQGIGTADVCVEVSVRSRHFVEVGQFLPRGQKRSTATRNAYLWQRQDHALLLAHERRGRDAPVALVRLIPVGLTVLKSERLHVCGSDHYGATLRLTHDGFVVDWTITGPRKDERLRSIYFS